MWQLIVILVSIACNALLAATELAFVSISKSRLRKFIAEGNETAKRVMLLKENPEKTLSVLQFGITFIGVIGAAVGGASSGEWIAPLLMKKWGISKTFGEILAILFFVVPYTYLNVVLSELLPKSLAWRSPKKVIFRASGWLVILGKILAPIVYLLEKSTKLGVKICSLWMKPEEMESEEAIFPGKLVRPYMLNLAKIEGRKAESIMIPWGEVDKLSVGSKLEVVKERIFKTGHTRLPIVDKELATGILHSKEFLAFLEKGDVNWQVLQKPVIKVQSSDSLIHCLKMMQSVRSHMSIVFRDEKPIGIVTIEDILEEIVGEIYDENDVIELSEERGR